MEWFHKIPERGDAEAQNNLGSCQDNGIGCEKNPEEAVK
ncbi:MAG: sel1 repeat family protein [Thermoguttaceae bacterium]|nr:sel1 repeat family protein [Thermoguttaceae bacterium]